jgi:tetratricopeptide (TPR) repeat protein
LAKADPTNPQWKCDAVDLLHLIGEEYERAGMCEEAIHARHEGCVILRELVTLDLRNRDLQRYLSILLGNLARNQLAAGDLRGALAHQEESLLIRRKLRQRTSTRAEQIADAELLASAGGLRFAIGNEEEALKIYQELLPIERALAASEPPDVSFQWKLSCTLDHLGDLRHALGDPRGGLLAYEESLSIRTHLGDLVAGQPSCSEELCSLLKKVGDLRREAGNCEAALPIYEERLATARRLFAMDPRSIEWHSILADSLEDLASIKAQRYCRAEAVEYYSESLFLRREIAEIDQLDESPLQNLSRTLEAIAALKCEDSKKEGRGFYEECLSLRRQFAEASMGNSERLQDLLRTLEMVSKVRYETGDRSGALSGYEELLSLRRTTSRDTADWQRAIWNDLNKIVALKLDLEDIDGALAAAEESLSILSLSAVDRATGASPLSEIASITIGAIVRQLSSADLQNEQRKGDLIFSLDQLCDVRFRAGDLSGALATYEELLQHQDAKPAARG